MQATSSHVTVSPLNAMTAAFPIESEADTYGTNLLPILTRSAEASKRSHLLVSRRKRANRRANR